MNKKEAAKLLDLIKLSYPHVYRDMDDAWKVATVNMWASSFPEVPYQIMEQAFNHYRMGNKFPPTVAEMVEELKQVYYQALECANIHKNLGNAEGLRYFSTIMSYTDRYKHPENLGTLQPQQLRLEGGWNGEEKANGPAYPELLIGTEGRHELWQVEGTEPPY